METQAEVGRGEALRPWTPAAEVVEDGTPCELRFGDVLGAFEDPGPFVYVEGAWYRIEPPTLIKGRVVGFRPVE